YVEAHGTGTEVGDPIEAEALGEVFADRQAAPWALGSVKTNIGHTGGAAGIAGLLKTVLAIENAAIPPSLNYSSPGMDLETLKLQVNTSLTPWQATPRRAGASSFGMGGTNAHVVLEQLPSSESVATDRIDAVVAWVVSGRSGGALGAGVERLLAGVGGLSAVDVGWSSDVCSSDQIGRAHV